MVNYNGENIDFFFSESNMNGRYTYASENFVKMDGRSSKELLDIDTKSIRHDDVPQYLLDEMYDWSRTKGYWEGVLKNVNKFGQDYWVKASVIQIHKNGATSYGMISVPATKEEIRKAEHNYTILKTMRYNQTDGRKSMLYPVKCIEDSIKQEKYNH